MAQVNSGDGFLRRIRDVFRSEKKHETAKRRPQVTGARAADWEYRTQVGAMIQGDDWMRLISGRRPARVTTDAARPRHPVL